MLDPQPRGPTSISMPPMKTPLKPWQKIVAYGSLAFVLAWTVFGVYAIWLTLTQG